MTITREQIEEWRAALLNNYAKSLSRSAEVNALCDLALRGLETQWRPIETAPKDGTEFQAWVVKDGVGFYEPVARYNATAQTFQGYDPGYYGPAGWYEFVGWMPQPEGPKP